MSQDIYDRIAEELNKQYPEANAQAHHSGGGIMVVVATLPNGRVVSIGDCAETWGADVYDSMGAWEEGLLTEGIIIETNIPGDSQDAPAIAHQILANNATMSAYVKQTLSRAMDKLVSAFLEVTDAWPVEFGDSFTDGYPFQLSFDEVGAEVITWVNKSKETLK